MTESRPSIFKHYAKNLLAVDSKKPAFTALKNHPQIPLIIDTLSRQKHHHLILTHCSSALTEQALLTVLAQQFLSGNVPKNLREIFFIYFDIVQFSLSVIEPKQVEQDFQTLFEEIRNKNKRMIFVVNQPDLLLDHHANPL